MATLKLVVVVLVDNKPRLALVTIREATTKVDMNNKVNREDTTTNNPDMEIIKLSSNIKLYSNGDSSI